MLTQQSRGPCANIASPPIELQTTTLQQPIARRRPENFNGIVDPPALRRNITPGVLLQAAVRKWRLSFALSVLMASTAAACTLTFRQEKYVSSALIKISSTEKKILAETIRTPDWDNGYVRTQLAIMRSRPVLRNALNDDRVRALPLVLDHADPIDWLEKELRAEQVDFTELIRLSLSNRGDGSDLAPIVNAVMDAYLELSVQGDQNSQQSRLKDLETAYRTNDEKVKQLRESLTNLTRDSRGSDHTILSLKQQILINEHAAAQRELAGVNSRDRELEVKLGNLRTRLYPGIESPIFTAVVGIPAAIFTLDRYEKERKANHASTYHNEREIDSDPRVATRDAEVSRLQKLVKQYEEVSVDERSIYLADARRRLELAIENARKTREEIRSAIHERLVELNSHESIIAMHEIETERILLQKQREALLSDLSSFKNEIDRLGLTSIEMELKKAEIDRSEQLLKAIWEQKERIEIELKASGRIRVEIYDRASKATVQNKLARIQESIGVGLLGGFLGIFLVSYRDLRKGRLHNDADISSGLGISLIGSIPVWKQPSLGKASSTNSNDTGKRFQMHEASVDAIRTRILAEVLPPQQIWDDPREKSPCRIIMITSAMSGEGKSALAAQLALSFARASFRTLLIDWDLQAPAQHVIFEKSLAPGLSDLFSNGDTEQETHLSLENLIHSDSRKNLDLLCAGENCSEARPILNPSMLRSIADVLRRNYDFILIDSTPVIVASDALMVARHVDGVIISVRAGVSHAADVYSGYEKIREHNLPFMGIVLNGFSQRRYSNA